MAVVEVSSLSGEVLARLRPEGTPATVAAVREAVDPMLPGAGARLELVLADGRLLEEADLAEGNVALTAVLSHEVPESRLRSFRKGEQRGEDHDGNPIFDVAVPSVRTSLEVHMREIAVPAGQPPASRQRSWREPQKDLAGPIAELVELSRAAAWHPRLARIYGAFLDSADGGPRAVLRLFVRGAVGPSAKSLVEGAGALAPASVRRYTTDVAGALRFLHDRNVPHGCLRSGSVCVDSDDHAVLSAPSGRLRRVVHELRWLHDWDFVGSIDLLWSPPEFSLRFLSDELSEDVWSLGCTVMEMATGRPPWQHLLTSESPHSWTDIFNVMENASPRTLPAESLSEDCCAFLGSVLVRDITARPKAHEVVAHAFLQPPPEPDLRLER